MARVAIAKIKTINSCLIFNFVKEFKLTHNRQFHPMTFYAHSCNDKPIKEWEPLYSTLKHMECDGVDCPLCADMDPNHGHINKVAWLAGNFAGEFFSDTQDGQIAKSWARTAGLWHDLGKFALEWQSYLKSKSSDSHIDEIIGKVDHSTAGAQHAVSTNKMLGHILAYVIAGHHCGLLDATSNTACLASRLNKTDVKDWSHAPRELLDLNTLALPKILSASNPDYRAFSMAFFTRMLFSCLVDADWLATESYMDPKRTKLRNKTPDNILVKIRDLISAKINSFPKPEPQDTVNLQRRIVVEDCRNAAKHPPGLFTLTVPTGGGKTLSSLLFSLEHAIKHGQKRIIFVVPFTSIIEQNAAVIRDILEPLSTAQFNPVIEHHSTLDPQKETTQSRLAAENWDAPIIVTTAVQFYESLYAAKTSACRKLHNIANSVIILDEAQSIPVEFLNPCLRVLEELSLRYHSSVVLCTATQPAVTYHEQDFPIGLKNCREIVSDTYSLFSALKRVDVENIGKTSDKILAEALLVHDQVLCIVNRRKHAKDLFKLLGRSEEHFHLSALMCPKHRSDILALVRKRLEQGQKVRLVSTQIIEAGVDIDFPVVYRSLAGADSIAQAAGRCNRNGRFKIGKTYIFEAEESKSEAYFRRSSDVTKQLLGLEEYSDILSQKAIQTYFDLYYYRNKSLWDSKHILDQSIFHMDGRDGSLPFKLQFQKAADLFKLIPDEYQVPVIVPYGGISSTDCSDEIPADLADLIGQLRNPLIPLNRETLRKLQAYSVQIPIKMRDYNVRSFDIIRDGEFYMLISRQINYSTDYGICFDKEEYIYNNLIS